MKVAVVVAGFAAGLATAHAGHGHQHAHNKRGDDSVYTSWDITTEWEYVTVTPGQEQAQPSAQPTAQGPDSVSQAAPSSSAVQAAPSSSAVQAAPSSSADVHAAAAPTAAPTGAVDVNAAQASINAAQKSADFAHQAAMQSLQANEGQSSGAAPAQSQPTQVSVQTASAVASSSPAAAPASQSAGSSTGDSGRVCTETHMTYYSGEGGLGSCGQPVLDGNATVAMGASFMKQSCGKTIDIFVNGGTEAHTATITDTCAACVDGHVDVAQDWAKQIAGDELVTKGLLPIKYCWN